MLKFGSLFSGIGGFDLGFEIAGLECAWQVEKDKVCQKVLSRHWPNVEKFEDVKNVGKNNLRSVDVICGGFPCQDLSIAGRRQGLAGERSGLWFEFVRIVGELEPRFVIIENVPGLLSSNRGKDFAVILRGLVERGYGVSWRILDAQYFGVAQRRRRVFIIGSLGNGSSARVLFESEGVSWDSPSRSKTGQGIAETFAFSAGNSGDSYGIGLSEELAPPLRAGASGTNQTPTIAMSLNAHGQRMDGESETFIAATLNSGGNKGGFRSEPREHIVAMPLLAKGHSSHDESLETYIAFDERNITSWANRSNPQVGDPCHTLHSDAPRLAFQQNQREEIRELGDQVGALTSEPGMHNQNFIASSGVRRLTPRECERLQGFQDDFTAWDADGKKIANSSRYRMLGNAIAVPCAKFIGSRIVDSH